MSTNLDWNSQNKKKRFGIYICAIISSFFKLNQDAYLTTLHSYGITPYIKQPYLAKLFNTL